MAVQYKNIRRSLRSYILNAAFRLFVRPQFTSGPLKLDKIRKVAKLFLDKLAIFPAGAHMRRTSFGSVPVYTVDVDGKTNTENVIFYLHGGAFLLETPNLHGAFLARLVQSTGCRGIMPSYRLAPENPFPAAPDDVLSVYQQLLDQGVDAKNIVLAGDSAGGCLALVLLMQLKRLGLPLPSCAVLISPCTDMRGDTSSFKYNMGQDPMFNQHITKYTDELYLSNKPELFLDDRVSPLLGDFSGLPPLFFSVGSTELLLDDSVLATQKAELAGVAVQCTVWTEMPHCFAIMPPLYLPEAKEALQVIGTFIQDNVVCGGEGDAKANELSFGH